MGNPIQENNGKEPGQSRTWIWVLSFLAAVTIILAVWLFIQAPHWKKDFGEVGAVGDFFNGMLAPFIAFISALLTFAAFYVQYQANEAQKAALQKQDAQQRIDRFEQRFFEMLKIHRENVASMQIHEVQWKQSDGIHLTEDDNPVLFQKDKCIQIINREFEISFAFFRILKGDVEGCDNFFDSANVAYDFVFYGRDNNWNPVGHHPSSNPEIPEDSLKDIQLSFREFFNQGLALEGKSSRHDQIERIFQVFKLIKGCPQIWIGYSDLLSPYFRHMFQIFRMLTEFKASGFDEDQRVEYAKLFRAQLSDEEQKLLYYNSLSVGSDWWDKGYIEKYQMLKNVHLNDIPVEISPVRRLQLYLNTNQMAFDLENVKEHFDYHITPEMCLES